MDGPGALRKVGSLRVVGDPGRLSVRGPLSVALKELEEWGTERPWGPGGGGSKEVPETGQEVRWRCRCLKCSLSSGNCPASFWGFTTLLSLRKQETVRLHVQCVWVFTFSCVFTAFWREIGQGPVKGC